MTKVPQQTHTAAPEPMPALEHLLRDKVSGIYYFRMALPRALVDRNISIERNGKKLKLEVRFSLKTSNQKAAASLAAYHAAIWRAKFDEKLREIEEQNLAKQAKDLLFQAHRD